MTDRQGETERTISVLQASAIDKWPTITLTPDQEVLSIETIVTVDSAYSQTWRHILRAVVVSDRYDQDG